jgi:predicted Fe-Mo cluster-binding NifX family protein
MAIPCEDDRISPHFGKARQFVFIDANPGPAEIKSEETLSVPSHEPGELPRWLVSMRVNVVLAASAGSRAIEALRDAGVQIVTGVTGDDPHEAATQYLKGEIKPRVSALR